MKLGKILLVLSLALFFQVNYPSTALAQDEEVKVKPKDKRIIVRKDLVGDSVAVDYDYDYCGPDVSRAYIAALQRVYRRMQDVPDSEKGLYDGAIFLKTNGWNIDQWPAYLDGAKGPSGECSRSGNSVGQDTYRLFGLCVPRHVINDIMYGFTADLLWVPTGIQELGAHWAEAKYNLPNKDEFTDDFEGHVKAIVEFADPEISQRSYELGDELAEEWDADNPMTAPEIEEKIGEGWVDFAEELKNTYPWLENCLQCPDGATISEWDRDWSRESWELSDGTKLNYTR